MKLFILPLLVAYVCADFAPECPDLVLPWQTYPGAVGYSWLGLDKVCKYPDVRFASAPIGPLRFAAPQYPPAKSSNGTAPAAPGPNMSCIQMSATRCLLGGPIGGGAKSCYPGTFGTQDEDCLFLDVYVPLSAFDSDTPLPVIVWIYGGGYTSGSKTQFDPNVIPFYEGYGPIAKTWGKAIFVAGNYRLGAYGWLAGDYMEKHGQPNAGLLDQRTVLQFVHDHISSVNGDPSKVSVWGESAGASSIMHHLVMPDNVANPLFNRAILQSPAYQWMWNRTGFLNDTFAEFAKNVSQACATVSACQTKCAVADLTCLRCAPAAVLQEVNQNFSQVVACNGIMPFGPAVDGKLVPHLAAYSLKYGQVTPIESVIVSHVDLEIPYANASSGFSFLPLPVREHPKDEAVFQGFLDEIFTGPDYVGIRKDISNQYPSGQYSDNIARVAAIITDSSFTCHTRFIINRYLNSSIPVYAMDYAVGRTYKGTEYNASVHASDLFPLFAKGLKTHYGSLIGCIVPKLQGLAATAVSLAITEYISPVMQTFFTNNAIGNDINDGVKSAETWQPAKLSGCTGSADSNKCVWNLMVPEILTAGSDYWSNNTGPDLYTSDRTCQFWDTVASRITAKFQALGEEEEEYNIFDSFGKGDQLVFQDEL